MINSPQFTADANARIIDSLAAMILDDDSALTLDDIDALADLLTATALMRLCIALDLCPYHHCDLDACDDDSRDCSDRIAALDPSIDD